MIVIRLDEAGCAFTAAAGLAGFAARFCGKLAPAPDALVLGFPTGACAGAIGCAGTVTCACNCEAAATGTTASALTKGVGASSPTESTVCRSGIGGAGVTFDATCVVPCVALACADSDALL